MNMFPVAVFAIFSCCTAVVLRHFSQTITPFVGLTASLLISGSAIIALGPVIDFIKSLDGGQNYEVYYEIMLKGLGIAILSESASDICRDCGELSLATKVELASKIAMLLLSIPLLEAILDLSKEMIAS